MYQIILTIDKDSTHNERRDTAQALGEALYALGVPVSGSKGRLILPRSDIAE